MISDHIRNIKGLIIDMDGVLWRDTQAIGDLPDVFSQLRALGLKFILATNNASRTVDEYIAKLANFNVLLEDDQIITAAQATGLYCRDHYGEGTRVYVVGQPSLKHTLASYGLKVIDGEAKDATVVVASIDFNLSYEKLKQASLLIQSGSDFVGTNPDRTLPTPTGLIPGSGTIIGALEIASGKKAKYIGKPEPLLYQMALRRLDIAPDETLAVGDRLETDILGGHAAGMHTALVLSGASTLSQAQKYDPKPDIITADLTELVF